MIERGGDSAAFPEVGRDARAVGPGMRDVGVHDVLSIKIFTIFTVSNTNLTRRRRARTRPRQHQKPRVPSTSAFSRVFPSVYSPPSTAPSSPRARVARRHADSNSLDESLAVRGERTFHRRVDRPLQRRRDLERSDEPLWHLGQNR